jgi:hypothetical protein
VPIDALGERDVMGPKKTRPDACAPGLAVISRAVGSLDRHLRAGYLKSRRAVFRRDYADEPVSDRSDGLV